jgi:hypothetical protein
MEHPAGYNRPAGTSDRLTVDGAAPPQRRAEVLSSFYVIVYLGVGMPVTGAGFLATAIGLLRSVQCFALTVAALCLSLTATHAHRNPRPPQPTPTATGDPASDRHRASGQ